MPTDFYLLISPLCRGNLGCGVRCVRVAATDATYMFKEFVLLSSSFIHPSTSLRDKDTITQLSHKCVSADEDLQTIQTVETCIL